MGSLGAKQKEIVKNNRKTYRISMALFSSRDLGHISACTQIQLVHDLKRDWWITLSWMETSAV